MPRGHYPRNRKTTSSKPTPSNHNRARSLAKTQLLSLARLGAEKRLVEIEAEAAQLRVFLGQTQGQTDGGQS